MTLMKFTFNLVNSLPRLAWCAKVTKGSCIVKVIHGPWVETSNLFFFEGAWDNNFEQGDFIDSTACFGSGGCIKNNKITFSTPIHNVEKLYSFRSEGNIIISNSLAFVLSQTGETIDYNYIFYSNDLDGICLGIHQYIKHIPLRSKRKIHLHIHRNRD